MSVFTFCSLIFQVVAVALVMVVLLVDSSNAYQVQQQQYRANNKSPMTTTFTRRRLLWNGVLGTLTSSGVVMSKSDVANALISSKYCASGKGEGCNDLAEGNEFIRSLQEKSAAKAETYAAVSKERKKNNIYLK